MENLEITRPKLEDEELINEFFEIVIRDTFEKNGISDLIDTLLEEIETKREWLRADFESSGRDRYFLIARLGDRIIGSISYGPSNELIVSCTSGKLRDVGEIGTVYVHPEYQNKGIGKRLLSEIYKILEKNGIKEFCLDSGYKTAQKTWVHRFGKPEYHMKDYWGEGSDHMIWRVDVKDVL